MLELRVLNGQLACHRIPLNDSPLLIGSDPRCALMLPELSVQAFHALLVLASDQSHILAIAGRPLLRYRKGEQDYFRVGTVWMVVADVDDIWSHSIDSEIEHGTYKLEKAAATQSLTTPLRKYLLSAILCMSMLWALTGTSHEQVAVKTHHVNISPRLPVALSTGLRDIAMEPQELSSREISNQHLQEEFKSRLESAGLLKRFSLQMGEDEWKLVGKLDDAEIKRFEPLFVSFIHEFSVRFPVSASIPAASTLLPFTIRQVVSGANARIVTGDGRQMAVGEIYAGFRLDAIRGTELTFSGKRSVVLHL